MDIFFPIFSCILVGSVLVCCCVRRRRLRRDDSVYIVVPSDAPTMYIQPQPSAPPMPTIYEEDPHL